MKILDRLNRAENATLAWGGVVLAVVLFSCISLIPWIGLGSQRLDLTQDRLFTVTDSTRQVLASIKEPITLRIYVSQGLLDSVPRLNIYSDRVNELLRAYRQLTNNK